MWKNKCQVEKVYYKCIRKHKPTINVANSIIVIVQNMLLLLFLCTTFQQLLAACSPGDIYLTYSESSILYWRFYVSYFNSGILSVSPSGVVRASLNQLLTFTCEIQGSGILWYANNRHISEGDNLDLELEESITVVLDSMECARQRNLTVLATSLANNISLTCLSLGILMPSPQILLLVEGMHIYIYIYIYWFPVFLSS